MSAFVQGVIDGAPKSLGCQECLAASTAPGNSCATPYGDCQNTSRACGQYSACVAGCRTVACRTACKTDNAAGFAARSDLTKCECSGACAAVCQGNETCSPAACRSHGPRRRVQGMYPAGMLFGGLAMRRRRDLQRVFR